MENYKLILVGDASVGKTNLLTKYVDNKYFPNNISTIGIEFKNKIIELNDGRKIRLQIWDTSGQEKFKALTKNYFRGCNGVLFVFDVTNQSSFDNIPLWINLYNEVNDENSIKILIGNKIDLDRVVDEKVARIFAEKHGLKYYEISAKDNKDQTINNMFDEIVKSLAKEQEVDILYNNNINDGIPSKESVGRNEVQNKQNIRLNKKSTKKAQKKKIKC